MICLMSKCDLLPSAVIFLWFPLDVFYMTDLKQYGILVVALMLGGGFAFGGIASYAGLVDTGSSDREQQRVTMPEQNYKEKPFNMSSRGQQALAYNRDVVFVNAFYETGEQRQQLQDLQQLPERFDDRVYVSVANSSADSDLMISYGIVEFPAVVVMGGSGSAQPENITVSAVSDAVCDSLRSLGEQSAQCL